MTGHLGFRVMRGPDWQDGDMDGGEGHLGTLHQLLSNQCVRVVWDNGKDGVYSAGADGKHQLRVFDSAPAGVRHPNTTCAECGERDIYGMLWRCEDCTGCDLCPVCYSNDKHDIRHQFLRLDHFQSKGQSVKKRKVSVRMRSMGIFPGAKVVRGPHWMWSDQDGGLGSQGEMKAFENVAPDSSRNLVRVQWLSKEVANSYRLGFQGQVDLQCVEEEVGPFYYRDHLPLLDTADLPYPLAPKDAFTASKLTTSPPQQQQQQQQQNASPSSPATTPETSAASAGDAGTTAAANSQTASGSANTSPSASGFNASAATPPTSSPPISSQLVQKNTDDADDDDDGGGDEGAVDENEGDTTMDEKAYELSFAVGDRVMIGVNENTLRDLQDDYGGVSSKMIEKIATAEGEITELTTSALVRFTSMTYRLNPLALVKVAPLKEGDVVRIRQDVDKVKLLNKRIAWSLQIAETCGTVGTVSYVNKDDRTVSVKFGHYQTFRYCPACCIPAPAASPDPVGAVGAARRANVTGDGTAKSPRGKAQTSGAAASTKPNLPARAGAQKGAQGCASPGGATRGASAGGATGGPVGGAMVSPTAGAGATGHNANIIPVSNYEDDGGKTNNGNNSDNDNTDLSKALMRAMGLTTVSDDDGDPQSKILFGAIAQGATSAVETLLRVNMSLMTKTIQSLTPLMYASHKGQNEIVTLLLNLGADVNARTDKGKSALLIAIDSNEEETALLLLDRGADPKVKNARQRSALHEAAYENCPRVLQMLLALGADVNAKDFVQDTPLFDAIQKGHQNIVEILLQVPELNTKELDIKGFNMLMIAALKGHAGCLEAILNSSRHPGVNDLLLGEYSALHIAANNDHVECVGLLVLVGGAIIDLGDGRRFLTPLHLACKRRHQKAAEALIQLGANVNAMDINGNTALHLAMGKSLEGDHDDSDISKDTAIEQRTQLACFLITSGAMVDTVDDEGKQPLSYGHPEVQENVWRFVKESGFDGSARGWKGSDDKMAVPVITSPVADEQKIGDLLEAVGSQSDLGATSSASSHASPQGEQEEKEEVHNINDENVKEKDDDDEKDFEGDGMELNKFD